MKSFLLLTGCTGFIGQYLLRDLLLRNIPTAVLVRGTSKESAEARVDDIVTRWERALGRPLDRPVCLEGDIGLPELGLSRASRDWATAHCGRILHNAASVKFHGGDKSGDPWMTNVVGTERVLDFCREVGITEFHYNSTAFVCGARTDTVLESDLDLEQKFRNDYEESKFHSESLVRRAEGFDSVTVYRPAVVVGDSQSGFTSTYHGLYHYIQFTWICAQAAERDEQGRWHHPVRLTVTGDELRNLVPVDWVSEATVRILQNPKLHGGTYHLTPKKATSTREILTALSDYFQFYGVTLEGNSDLSAEPAPPVEQTFYEYVNGYQEYWQSEPVFDRSAIEAALPDFEAPDMDKACLRRLIDFAVKDRFGRKARKPKAAPVAERS